MRHLDPSTRHAVFATLAAAVAVDDGPTVEQRRLLGVVGTHVLGVTASPDPLEPAAAAAALPDPDVRRLVIEGLVVFELVRHPASAALTDRVGAYITALGGDEDAQRIARDYVADARAQVAADWARVREPETIEGAGDADLDESELGRRLRALASCPPGSVGRSFHDFYDRHGFPLPPDHASLVSHDFAHVLAGYEATPEGEIALQAMLVAATGGAAHFPGLLASLLLFEVGMLPFPGIDPKEAVLDRPGAAALFADALVRGAACGQDFQALDHLALASRSLREVRSELDIPAPVDGPFTFSV